MRKTAICLQTTPGSANQIVTKSLILFYLGECSFPDWINDLGTYSTVNEACDQPTATLYLEELLIKDDKEVIRMFNLLGREIQNPKNELVIILYSDGSTEKKFID